MCCEIQQWTICIAATLESYANYHCRTIWGQMDMPMSLYAPSASWWRNANLPILTMRLQLGRILPSPIPILQMHYFLAISSALISQSSIPNNPSLLTWYVTRIIYVLSKSDKVWVQETSGMLERNSEGGKHLRSHLSCRTQRRSYLPEKLKVHNERNKKKYYHETFHFPYPCYPFKLSRGDGIIYILGNARIEYRIIVILRFHCTWHSACACTDNASQSWYVSATLWRHNVKNWDIIIPLFQ